MKEMQFTPTTQLNDIKHKAKNIERMLDEGEKVKLSVRFSKRESAHPDLGKKILDQTVNLIPGIIIDRQAILDGRMMSMIVSRKRPKKNDGKQIQNK